MIAWTKTATVAAVVATMGAFSLAASPAIADPISSLTASFYTLAPNHPDVEHGIDGAAVTGLVNSTLTGGLPTVSAFGASYSGPSGPLTDVDGSGQLLWWTPQAGLVSFVSSGTVMLPYDQHLFPNGSSDGPGVGYTSARLDGTFSLPDAGSITLNLGSDDDVWVFVDGRLVADNGGVHADLVAPTVTTPLSGGTHTIDVFFADRHTVESQLTFSANVFFTPIPEPASMALLGAGLVGLGLVRRRRRD